MNLYPTPDSGLTDTYSTSGYGRSCSLHCRSFGHVLLHTRGVINPLYHCRRSAGDRQDKCNREIRK